MSIIFIYIFSLYLIFCIFIVLCLYLSTNPRKSEVDRRIIELRYKYKTMEKNKRISLEICEKKDMLGILRKDIYDVGNNCEPWYSRECIYVLDNILTNNTFGLEWSAGSSTVWLGYRVGKLISIENSYGWYKKVKKVVERLNLSERINLYNIKPDELDYCKNKSIYISKFYKTDVCFKTYITTTILPNIYFDFISIDGRGRNGCINRALEILKKENGILLLDNSERIRYKSAIQNIPYFWSRYDFNYSLSVVTLWITHTKHFF